MARHLVKPFSLYVLDGAIEAITSMHKSGWTHNDMHSGNAMLDSKLKVKVIDFGLARSIRDTDGVLQVRNFQQDIGNVLRIFSGLYTTQEYTSVWDMQKNYGDIQNKEGYMGLSQSDRIELFNLIDAALKITHPSEVEGYRTMVTESLENALSDSGLTADQLRKQAAALLFPEKFQAIHGYQDEDESEDESDCLTATGAADSVEYDDALDISDEQIEELRNKFGIAVVL